MHEQNELLVVQIASMFACPMVQVTLHKNKKKHKNQGMVTLVVHNKTVANWTRQTEGKQV